MKSEPKQTIFAPEYDYTIFEMLNKDVNYEDLAKLILSKEKEIVSLPVTGDAYIPYYVSGGYVCLGYPTVK